jgi:hypothetical protein
MPTAAGAAYYEPDRSGSYCILNPFTNGSRSPIAVASRWLTRDATAVDPLLQTHPATVRRWVRQRRTERPAPERERATKE